MLHSPAFWRRGSRGVTVSVVVVLALSIGVAATVFNLANGVLWRQPDLPNPGQLYAVQQLSASGNGYDGWVTARTAAIWSRAHIAGFELGGFTDESDLARSGNFAAMVNVTGLTPGTLAMLGVHPALGRNFAASDEGSASEPVVILSQRLFQQSLGGDSGLVGRAHIKLGSIHCRVIGVMPPRFHVPTSEYVASQPEAWVPNALLSRIDGWPGSDSAAALVRVASGTNLRALAAHLYALESAGVKVRSYHGLQLTPVREAAAADERPAVLILLAGGAAILLLGFLNAACLLGAAAMERRTDRNIRMALGASSARLRRDAAMAGARLGFLGGLGGLGIGLLGVHAVDTLAPFYLPSPAAGSANTTVLAGMVGAAVVLGALAGAFSGGHRLVPLRSGRIRLRSLAVAEIAISVAMVFAATLVTLSFVKLANMPLGYSTQHIVYARLRTGQKGLPPAGQQIAAASLLYAMQQHPELSQVAIANAAPGLANWYGQAAAGWHPITPSTPQRQVWFATPGYFTLLHMPVLEGSLTGYRLGSNAVAVDPAAARQLFGTVHAVGRRLTWGYTGHAQRATVVAVVGAIRESRFRPPGPHIYTAAAPTFSGYWTLLAHARGPLAPALTALGEVAAASSLHAATHALGSLAVRQTPSIARFQSATGLTFALLALLIGLISVFAFMAQQVAERRREMAIRLALGDSPQGLFARIVGDTAMLAAVGAAAGALAAWWTGGAIHTLLFAVSPTDARLLAGAAVAVLAAATAAGVIPALRAARTDPNQLLRDC